MRQARAIWLKLDVREADVRLNSRVHMRLFGKQSRMRPRSMFFKYSNGQNSNFMCRMVLEWREHEHGDVEEVVRAYLMAQHALRACGLVLVA